MNRRTLLQIGFTGMVSTLADGWPAGAQTIRLETSSHLPETAITAAPLTYVIDYAIDHLENPAYIRKLAAAPPCLLHVGHDTPFKGANGPRKASAPVGATDAVPYRLLTPAGLKVYVRSIQEFVKQVHRSGVRATFPYTCNQTMGGDDRKRTGFWEFYDHWNDYREFGLPPKPPADPVEWLQRDPEGNLHFNYPKAHPTFAPGYRYAPCPNNEYWTQYLSFVAREVARCGYDGIFVDNNILHCYCRSCQAAFPHYLRQRYNDAQLEHRFGTADPDKLKMHWQADKTYFATKQPVFRDFLLAQGDPEEFRKRFQVGDLRTLKEMDEIGYGYLHGRALAFLRELQKKYTRRELKARYGVEDFADLGLQTPVQRLLWFETQKFWAWSIAENLKHLRQAAEKYKPGFLIVPNWGAMESVTSVDARRVDAKDVGEWSRSCVYVMFEEDGIPGRIARGVYHDFILEYKFGLANGVRPVVLSYGELSRANVELANAEAAAGGGGAYVQHSYAFPEVRTRYRKFMEQHADLYEGFHSLAHVGVAFLFDQVLLENIEHLRQQYYLRTALSDGHFLFDCLTLRDLTRQQLAHYNVLILPHVTYIDSRTVAALEVWVRDGGILILAGDLGTHDETARRRPVPAFSKWFQNPNAQLHGDFRVATLEKGKAVWIERIDSLAPLSEGEKNLVEVGGRAFVQALARMTASDVRAGGPLISLLPQLGCKRLQITERQDLPGLRASAYWKSEGNRATVVLHFVNYELSASEGPAPARDVPVSVLLPAVSRNWKPSRIRSHSPGRETAVELSGTVRDGYLNFQLPEVRVYEVAEAHLRA